MDWTGEIEFQEEGKSNIWCHMSGNTKSGKKMSNEKVKKKPEFLLLQKYSSQGWDVKLSVALKKNFIKKTPDFC